MKIPEGMLIENLPSEEIDEDEEGHAGAVPRGLTRIIDKMCVDINIPEIATDGCFANRTILTTTNAETTKRIPLSPGFFTPSISAHQLTLKKGSPIMMKRNLNPDLGSCNGTRLHGVDLKPHVVHATILTSERHGQHVLIPRNVFLSDEDAREFTFRLCRKQLPVQPSFV
ncbi:hypothetical protein PC117_g11312 [Phytophthora cactorum]|uniref:DNA helicase Pif1-like 2B domain-containing protein n=1 Tax=Phytophthora cactorum TaxID=29920 RepID=A0A8T1DEJ9_9STRA|nr:hypothetical protein PC117_g11312 [Phytophthora cactorum]